MAELPPFVPAITYDGDVSEFRKFGPHLAPIEFDGWRHEVRSWKDGAYLGSVLCLSPTYRVSGPDARRFLSDHFVNNFASLKVGGSRHGLMCDERGRIMMDGTVLRTGEQDYTAIWLSPYIQYALESSRGRYDATGEDLTGREFLFQVAGPRSLPILERAAGEDLRDIGFARHRAASVGGARVRVYRLGMAGGLAYEVHGQVPDARVVYQAIWEAGQEHGLRKLGMRAYLMNHTEDGFPQAYMHYPYPWFEDPGFAAWLNGRGPAVSYMMLRPRLWGSLGDDLAKRYVTPFDVGWENRIHWDHSFPGREALASLAPDPPRTVVTLEWNADDIADVYRSQFAGPDAGEPYMPLNLAGPSDVLPDAGIPDPVTGLPRTKDYHADLVLAADGGEIGFSAGRIESVTYQRMISLGFIARSHAALGTEVAVVWGNPGTRQKRIRATVARFPYLLGERNDAIDVRALPRA
jgi:glycine cleavage system aminomethyltransferase T